MSVFFYQKNIKKTRKVLKNFKISAILISNFYNLLYLSGFKFLLEREGWLLVTQKNTYLFTDGRYLNQKQKEILKSRGIIPCLLLPEKNLLSQLKEIIAKEKIGLFGFEADDLRLSEYQKIKKELALTKLIPTEKLIIKLREIKEKEEIEKIKKACEIADQCLREVVKTIKIGIKEKEIAFNIEFWAKKKGYELAFFPIVAIDENSSLPHYDTLTAGQKKVKKDSVILVDFGLKYQNYCSDLTRIIFVNKPDTEKINLYFALLKAQEETIRYLKKEEKAKNIDEFCRKILNFSYPHSTGHGLGLEIHEYPKISKNSTDLIKKNQVFTIEPGLYLEGKFGFRIEDTVFMKEKNQPEILTKFPKKITIINR